MSAQRMSADVSMADLYRIEAEDQTQILTTRLLALERAPAAPEHLEACMRAAHSLKGAARIIGFEEGVRVAHAMEDCFVAAQQGTLTLDQQQIDAFLRDVDILKNPTRDSTAPDSAGTEDHVALADPVRAPAASTHPAPPPLASRESDDRMLRVTAEHLNRLLRLAGESLVDARRRKHGEDHALRLYEAALACRMRPFRDGVQPFPRMIRDLARSLGKRVRLEIRGEATQVDRDILARLEAPLGHLLRNAVDHGVELPGERVASGKPEEAVITLEARHNSGHLQVGVSDDGHGISVEAIRVAAVARSVATRETAARLGTAELLEFLFLPGFTLKETVTDVSGRGVGLDAVRDVLKQVRGTVHVTTQPGRGTKFQMQLPLTLSVERTLLVQIADEPYALPLSQITRTAKISRDRIEYLEGRPHFYDGGRSIGLIAARQLLRGEAGEFGVGEISVVLLGNHERSCALVVERFLGERELVVQPLDPRLGKVQDVAAAAVMEDGAPVLILDVEDIIRSVEKLASAGARLDGSGLIASAIADKPTQRVLVVDDSLTVRELERKLLTAAGYQVDIASDGMDGWNAVRNGRYDLIVTDIDMPRMDGIELVTLIRKDPHLQTLPVMIVSYKDRAEDRQRGLDAGADHYLAKGSFHDDALLGAVRELIGDAVQS